MQSKDLATFDELPNAAHVDVSVVAALFDARLQRFGLVCAETSYRNRKSSVPTLGGMLAS